MGLRMEDGAFPLLYRLQDSGVRREQQRTCDCDGFDCRSTSGDFRIDDHRTDRSPQCRPQGRYNTWDWSP